MMRIRDEKMNEDETRQRRGEIELRRIDMLHFFASSSSNTQHVAKRGREQLFE
jgi:hypothetical protein